MSNLENTFKKIKKVAKTGLLNLDECSYLNSVLQCFGNIKNIANYLLDQENILKINNNMMNNNINPLSFVIGRLFQHLYPYPERNEREIYSTEKILKILSTMSVFQKNRNSPVQFLIFLLDTLHEELNENKNDNSNSGNSNETQPAKIIKDGIDTFKKTNNSIISNNFNWFGIKENHCQYCNDIKYEFKSFSTFDLNISKFYKNNKKDNITIYECLDYLNQYYEDKNCINCRSSKIKISYKINKSPNIFTFILDRDDLNEELLKIPFNIEEKINLNKYIEDENSIKEYELIGIVSISLRERKYIAFAKSPIDKKWYLYNDTKVNQINIDFTLKSHNQFNFYVPCILFYESLNNINKN